MDRIYKINNTWSGFHKDIQHLITILKKNMYPGHVIDKIINRSISKKLVPGGVDTSSNQDQANIFYFKLPFIGDYSSFTQKRLALLAKRYCNNINIKLVFNSFKIGSLFSVKDPIPSDLRARVVYKFSCAGCTASYVGETVRHLATRVNEHLISDRASHIFKHLERNETCLRLCSKKCFQVLDSAATEFSLKIKEAIHIKRENPSLNSQVKHVNLKLFL